MTYAYIINKTYRQMYTTNHQQTSITKRMKYKNYLKQFLYDIKANQMIQTLFPSK